VRQRSTRCRELRQPTDREAMRRLRERIDAITGRETTALAYS
jgi:hypothetical protein